MLSLFLKLLTIIHKNTDFTTMKHGILKTCKYSPAYFKKCKYSPADFIQFIFACQRCCGTTEQVQTQALQTQELEDVFQGHIYANDVKGTGRASPFRRLAYNYHADTFLFKGDDCQPDDFKFTKTGKDGHGDYYEVECILKYDEEINGKSKFTINLEEPYGGYGQRHEKKTTAVNTHKTEVAQWRIQKLTNGYQIYIMSGEEKWYLKEILKNHMGRKEMVLVPHPS